MSGKAGDQECGDRKHDSQGPENQERDDRKSKDSEDQEHEEQKSENQKHENDVSLGPLAKDGEKLMASLEAGHMVGILSKNEVMYTLIHEGMYRCFIHPLGAEEGRQKAFPMDEAHRAVIKNLADLADQMFEIRYHAGMHPMGVMFAAEQGIIEFLDMIGELPAADHDFMA